MQCCTPFVQYSFEEAGFLNEPCLLSTGVSSHLDKARKAKGLLLLMPWACTVTSLSVSSSFSWQSIGIASSLRGGYGLRGGAHRGYGSALMFSRCKSGVLVRSKWWSCAKDQSARGRELTCTIWRPTSKAPAVTAAAATPERKALGLASCQGHKQTNSQQASRVQVAAHVSNHKQTSNHQASPAILVLATSVPLRGKPPVLITLLKVPCCATRHLQLNPFA